MCVSGDTPRRSHVKLGSAADFSLNINETDLSSLTASIKSPSNTDVPCVLKRMANNHIGKTAAAKHQSVIQILFLAPPTPTSFLLLPSGISFIPHEAGEHLVSILKNGHHLSDIPIMVVQSEIGDATLVKATGDGLVKGTTFSDASFIVDTREAGQCQCRSAGATRATGREYPQL